MISEQYRLAAKEWAAAEAAADLLEQSKSAVLAQHMIALGDLPVSKAEMQVKASPVWHEFIVELCEARARANLLKVKLEFVRMKFSEWQSKEATARAERRL